MSMRVISVLLCLMFCIGVVGVTVSAESYGMTTEYSINSSALSYFRSVLAGMPAGMQYIIFQSSRYVTVLMYGSLSVNGLTVTCDDGYKVVYDSQSYDDRRYTSFSSASGDTVTAVEGLVFYTNLQDLTSGPNAAVAEYEDAETAQTITNILVALVFFGFLYVAFKFIRRRWVEAW